MKHNAVRIGIVFLAFIFAGAMLSGCGEEQPEPEGNHGGGNGRG